MYPHTVNIASFNDTIDPNFSLPYSLSASPKLKPQVGIKLKAGTRILRFFHKFRHKSTKLKKDATIQVNFQSDKEEYKATSTRTLLKYLDLFYPVFKSKIQMKQDSAQEMNRIRTRSLILSTTRSTDCEERFFPSSTITNLSPLETTFGRLNLVDIPGLSPGHSSDSGYSFTDSAPIAHTNKERLQSRLNRFERISTTERTSQISPEHS